VGVTGAENRVVFLPMSDSDEPDHPAPVTNEDLVKTLKERTRKLPADERLDEAPHGADSFNL
jgi:hypothetical protein